MQEQKLLNWRDVSRLLGVGRSKALRIVHMLDPIYIGRTPMIMEASLWSYIRQNGGIRVEWRS